MTQTPTVVAALLVSSCAASNEVVRALPHGEEDQPMSRTVTGAFEVTMTPRESDRPHGRFALDKSYAGPLSASAAGEMLTVMTELEGSQVYVAVEKVEGTLEGKKGTFHLVHRGVMERGRGDLSIVIVPDSGTGELVGLSGTMDVQIENNEHTYVLTYSLP